MDIQGRKVTIHAADLDGFLKDIDKERIDYVNKLYETSIEACKEIESKKGGKEKLVEAQGQIGAYLEKVVEEEPRIHVYCFESPKEQHAAASRLVAKLRDPETGHEEFLYYIQRAYELLFTHIYTDYAIKNKRPIITKTPVINPCKAPTPT